MNKWSQCAVVDVVPQEDFVLDHNLHPNVATRHRLGQDGEVAAIGSALEEDVGDISAVEPLHRPRCV
jgi:hypothetical protein